MRQAPTTPRTSTTRARALLAWLTVALSVVILGALACTTTSTTTLLPTTGIVVRSETLTAGRGCGKNPENLFKYAVVVFGFTSGPAEDATSFATPVTSNVFDCFTDGEFIQLDPVAGSSKFRLEVYAFNEAAYDASRAAIDSAGTDTSALRRSGPTWTTQCTATQQPDVQVLALCSPLAAGLGAVGEAAGPTRLALATTTFHLSDGRTAICDTAADAGLNLDGGADGSADGAADAVVDAGADADAGPAAAPAPIDAGGDAAVATGGTVTFARARIRYRNDQIVGPTAEVACGDTYIADLPSDPARYDIDVGVLDRAGSPIGTTVCSTTAQTGATNTAVCP